MDAAIVTVGDELLAGDTENTNATWLAKRLTGRGVDVKRVLTVPDGLDVIADAVSRYAADYEAVLVTGGLGGTHDDLTMAAVARAFDRSLAIDDDAVADIRKTMAAFREANPDLEERFPELSIDVDAQASIPEGARALLNPVGLSPGCVCENVYVMPGIPEEMYAVFDLVAEEFGGDVTSQTLYTPAPEGATTTYLDAVRGDHDVTVGSYPARGDRFNRIKITATDPEAVRAAVTDLRDRVEIVDPEDEGTD
jgi:molybdenum cofactor synthesis domain-containing protein